jgi:hypothetical protein
VSPGKSTPAPTPTVVGTQVPLTNWQLWLTLFVDQY